jgi:ubiquinone/menaquinone biosynthesis C-methylase UbiE
MRALDRSTNALENSDAAVVKGFGREWAAFDQSGVSQQELRQAFEKYFALFPASALNEQAAGFDAGCGSGRWASFVAPSVKELHCVDASEEALGVAKRMLGGFGNVQFHHASVADIPLPDRSMDFGYSLGVLHHLPDTQGALNHCAQKLRPGAPFLLYLYYAFDNRPLWFRALWRVSDAARRVISRLPFALQRLISDLIALVLYWPAARMARLCEKRSWAHSLPLFFYRRSSFYIMRNDALDRFATKLEKRFTAAEIVTMMQNAGFQNIQVNPHEPYWCVLGIRQ